MVLSKPLPAASRMAGLALMAASAVVFSVMSLFVGLAKNAGVGTSLSTLARFLFGLVAALFIIGVSPDLRRPVRNGRWLLVRGVTGAIAVGVFFMSMEWLGIARATLFNYTYPVFAAMLAWPLLGERPRAGTWPAVALSVVGAGMIAMSKADALPEAQAGRVIVHSAIALLGGVAAGVAVCAIRILRRTENSYVIFSSQCSFGLVFALLWLMADPSGRGRATVSMPTVWAILFAVGALGMTGQLLMTFSFKLVSAAEGSLLGLLTPCLNLFLGMFLFDEKFRAPALIGALLVLGSCLSVAVSKESTT